jgi:hypothetical protein
VAFAIGVGAERPEVGGGVRSSDEGQRAGLVFAIERRHAGEAARSGVVGVVEPEADEDEVGLAVLGGGRVGRGGFVEGEVLLLRSGSCSTSWPTAAA